MKSKLLTLLFGSLLAISCSNEEDPTPSLISVSGTQIIVDEDAGVASFTVTLDAPQNEPVTAVLSFAPGTVAADLGPDYSVSNTSLVIPAGMMQATLDVTIVDDIEFEGGGESFIITISAVQGLADLGTNLSTEVIINDNEMLIDLGFGGPSDPDTGTDPDLEILVIYDTNDDNVIDLQVDPFALTTSTDEPESFVISSDDPDGRYWISALYLAGTVDVDFTMTLVFPDNSTEVFSASITSADVGFFFVIFEVNKTGNSFVEGVTTKTGGMQRLSYEL